MAQPSRHIKSRNLERVLRMAFSMRLKLSMSAARDGLKAKLKYSGCNLGSGGHEYSIRPFLRLDLAMPTETFILVIS